MRVDLSLGTAAANVLETTAFDMAADDTDALRFYFLANGLTMATSDAFTIFSLDSAGPASEVAVEVIRTAGGEFQLRAGDGVTTRTTSLIQNVWHSIELVYNLDAGGANDGTIDFYVDGYQVGAQITGADQAVITQARFGAMSIDAGTTAGILLFDNIILDATDRVFPERQRFANPRTVTESEHIFVGPGTVQSVTLLSTTGGPIRLFDTDTANADGVYNLIAELDATTHTNWEGPFVFRRGCYCQLAGTDPRVLVSLPTSAHTTDSDGPLYYSQAGYKAWALGRRTYA